MNHQLSSMLRPLIHLWAINMYRASLGLSTPIKISDLIKLPPQAEFGYVVMSFHNKTIANENKNSDYHELEGINLNGWQYSFLISYLYKLNEKFSLGLTTGYEFIYIPRENFGRPYNQEMHSIGIALQAIISL